MTYPLGESKLIGVRQFVGRWYLYWKDTNRDICSFASEIEAYSARRSILQSL
jgi:hypothetical protein